MTRTKLWRLSLAAILGFGWLLVTPAYSDDPLSLAAQQIQKLNNSVNDLNYKDDFVSLIRISESKYDEAVIAKESMDNASGTYDDAVLEKSTALINKTNSQNIVDDQTLLVEGSLQQKNEAKDILDIANLNLQTTQSNLQSASMQGVSFQIYPLSRDFYGNAYISQGAGIMCQGSNPYFDTYAGSWAICGLNDNIIGIFRATLTLPEEIDDVYFAGYTDDGFRLYVDGVLETSQWREQGATWSPYTRHFDTSVDKTLELEAWWYNGGGPGSLHVGYGYNGIWTGVSSQYLSYGSGATQEQIDEYNSALAAQEAAQTNYNTKLSEYNSDLQILQTSQQNLTLADENLTIADQNLTSASNVKNNAIELYNQSIVILNNSIDDAWVYYEEQKAREIASALAQAAAAAAENQPTPEPSVEPTQEVTPEPSQEPTPEQTEQVDPTPEPTPETTNEENPDPTPSPEPSQEPSPQPTDIDPEPTPEPEPTLIEPSEESQDNTIIVDEELKELIPEKGTGTSEDLSGVIANLTSKDNKLVILSEEQIAAVSQTLNALTKEAEQEVADDLGIKSSDIALIAEAMKSNPSLAVAFVEFKDREAAAEGATMPYTLADATTEVQTEAFLADPIGALTNINFEKVFSPAEWGKDMTDDQREKAQEVVIPVIIASNIVAAAMTRRI